MRTRLSVRIFGLSIMLSLAGCMRPVPVIAPVILDVSPIRGFDKSYEQVDPLAISHGMPYLVDQCYAFQGGDQGETAFLITRNEGEQILYMQRDMDPEDRRRPMFAEMLDFLRSKDADLTKNQVVCIAH